MGSEMCIRDSKLPSDAFAKAITRVQEAFERCPGNTRSGQPTLSKHAVNAAVGAMESLDSCSTWHCISSRCEEDVSKFMPVGEVFDNGVCLDVFRRRITFLMSRTSPYATKYFRWST